MDSGFLLDAAPSYEKSEILVAEFDDYEDEEKPDYEDALQKQMLMDNLDLRNADWSWGRI